MKATDKVKRVQRTIEFLEERAAEIRLRYTSENLLAESAERFQIAGWLREDLGLPKREGACSVAYCSQPVGADAKHCEYHAKHPPAAECDGCDVEVAP